MKENKIANALEIVAFCTFTLGGLGSISLGIIFESLILAIAELLVCIITGIMFLGFSEIIKLLQKSTDSYETLIGLIQTGSIHQNKNFKTELQDIEENLPEL